MTHGRLGGLLALQDLHSAVLEGFRQNPEHVGEGGRVELEDRDHESLGRLYNKNCVRCEELAASFNPPRCNKSAHNFSATVNCLKSTHPTPLPHFRILPRTPKSALTLPHSPDISECSHAQQIFPTEPTFLTGWLLGSVVHVMMRESASRVSLVLVISPGFIMAESSMRNSSKPCLTCNEKRPLTTRAERLRMTRAIFC